MTTVKRIKPTEEELKILRDKLNSIADIPVENKKLSKQPLGEKQNKKDLLINEKENSNKDIVISQLTKKVSDLQDALPKNSFKISNYDTLINENNDLKEQIEKFNKAPNKRGNNEEILEDYFNPSPIEKNNNTIQNNENVQSLLNEIAKLKTENIQINQKLKEQSKSLYNYEKQNKIAQYVNNESDLSNSDYVKLSILTLLNKNKINDKCQNVLNNLFKNEKKELVSFLFARIDSLEYQNYLLISKIDYYIKLILHFIDQLCEYIDIVGDIRNVLNVVPNTADMNEDFFVIRDTLNKKEDILIQEKNKILDKKSQIEQTDILNKNLNIILCKDKVSETKMNISNPIFGVNFEKCSEIANEKINEMESLRDILSKYEDFIKYLQSENPDEELDNFLKYKEDLNIYNSFLKDNNIKLKSLLVEILKSNEATLNENLSNKINRVLNETGYGLEMYEDLIAMMKVQAMLIEYDMGKGNYN